MFSCGSGENWQIGQGQTKTDLFLPQRVKGDYQGGRQIVCGYAHVMLLDGMLSMLMVLTVVRKK